MFTIVLALVGLIIDFVIVCMLAIGIVLLPFMLIAWIVDRIGTSKK